MLSALHDASSAGHLGVTKTVERVRERFYWYGLQHDVEDWYQHCEKCARRKSPQATARGPSVSSCPGYLFERIVLNIVGPLPAMESGSKLSSRISPCCQRLFHEMERGICYFRPGSKDHSREAGERSHSQVWSARKDPLRPGMKL